MGNIKEGVDHSTPENRLQRLQEFALLQVKLRRRQRYEAALIRELARYEPDPLDEDISMYVSSLAVTRPEIRGED